MDLNDSADEFNVYCPFYLLRRNYSPKNIDLVNASICGRKVPSDLIQYINSNVLILLELHVGKNNINVVVVCSTKEIICNIIINYTPPIQEGDRVRLILLQASNNDRGTISNDVISMISRKLKLNVKLIQMLIADETDEYNRTFQFHDSITIQTLPFTTTELEKLSSVDVYWKVVQHLICLDLWNDNTKYLVFIGWTAASECDNSIIDGYINQSSGNVACVHTGGLWCWPAETDEVVSSFVNSDPVPFGKINDSYGRNTIGTCYATTLGAVYHELGHLFGLGHTESGIMSRGFDYLQDRFVLKDDYFNEQPFLKSQSLIFLEYTRFLQPFSGPPKCSTEMMYCSVDDRKTFSACCQFVCAEIRIDTFVVNSFQFSPFFKKYWSLPDSVSRSFLDSNLSVCLVSNCGVVFSKRV